MNYQETLQFLSTLSLAHWVILVAGYIVSVALGAALFLRRFLKKERRLYRNLKRPIMIITPTDESNGQIRGKEMLIERDLLTRNGFLKLDGAVSDYRSFNPLNNHCLVVLGYDSNMVGLGEVLQKVKQLQIPLIVYTYNTNVGVISDGHKQLFDSYPLTIYANFQLTLINHIFATLAVYPYDDKK